MTDRLEIEITPSERTAVITRELVQGRQLTPADVAEMTGCELRSGYRVLERLSRVLPLIEDEGRWSMVDLNLNIDT